MLIKDFNNTIDLWIKALDQYDFRQLCTKPSADGWSLGQVYVHLIDDTNYYIEQVKLCIATNEHSLEEASPTAKVMFLNNDFPDMAIEGAPSNSTMPQPESKAQLITHLTDIKNEINLLLELLEKSPAKGKTKHPGLHYFNAPEWLQFAEMHFRHHLRQKKRIDHFLEQLSV